MDGVVQLRPVEPPRPPANDDAERALLGGILHSNRAFERVSDFLRPEHFASRVHGRIYEAIAKVIERGQIADAITLKQYFEADADLAEVGGFAYLMRLAGSVASIVNAEDYGRAVYDLHLRRELIALGDEITARAYRDDLDDQAPDQIEAAEQRLAALAEHGTENTTHTFSQALTRTLASAERAYKHDGPSGVPSGFIDLDKLLGGLHQTDLIILAGRPSMGKTALATNLAFNAALHSAQQIPTNGRPPIVAFFSLEMSAEQLTLRILSERTSIPSERIRRGELSLAEFEELALKAQELERLPLVIDDGAGATVAQIRNKARRLKRQNKGQLALIVVDYLQLMSAGKDAKGNRVEVVSEITRGLKLVAKELNVPVVALSQLSRAVENRDDKRPQLSDLRESGSIEQDADVVMFVYRDEYYLARKEPPDESSPEHVAWQEEMEKVANLAEVLIGKQRHGPIGKVTLFFRSDLTRFENYAPSRWS